MRKVVDITIDSGSLILLFYEHTPWLHPKTDEAPN